ncbi:hypothetical protein EV368DRAFT_62864 [Lentinula lateritia]|nr:hypothetical protein EV368DRAFT_62864 [Lentinula lateritia]
MGYPLVSWGISVGRRNNNGTLLSHILLAGKQTWRTWGSLRRGEFTIKKADKIKTNLLKSERAREMRHNPNRKSCILIPQIDRSRATQDEWVKRFLWYLHEWIMVTTRTVNSIDCWFWRNSTECKVPVPHTYTFLSFPGWKHRSRRLLRSNAKSDRWTVEVVLVRKMPDADLPFSCPPLGDRNSMKSPTVGNNMTSLTMQGFGGGGQ